MRRQMRSTRVLPAARAPTAGHEPQPCRAVQLVAPQSNMDWLRNTVTASRGILRGSRADNITRQNHLAIP